MNTEAAHASSTANDETADGSATLGKWETAGSVFWFAMDSAWMAEQLLVAQTLILPAVACHVYALRLYAMKSDRLVGAAVLFWLAMNICWMLAEIHSVPGLLMGARMFSVLGFVSLLGVMLTDSRGGVFLDRLQRFRRLKVSKPPKA